MTQILLYQSQRGIALATDSKAVTFLSGEQPNYMVIEKIFPLNPHVLLVTGGAGYGVLLCQEFREYIKSAGLSAFDEIRDVAVSYLQQRMEKIFQEKLYSADRQELERVYFLLAGYAPETPQDPFRFELLGSEHCRDPLHLINTGQAVAIPRQMGIEYRLSRLPTSGNELDEAESLCENFLVKISSESSEVGPPFYFVRITSAGISIRTRDSLT